MYSLSLHFISPLLVKLTDYGTAEFDGLFGENFRKAGGNASIDEVCESTKKVLTSLQFTTLENTPIDFIMMGNKVKGDFAADTWGFRSWKLGWSR